MKHCEFCDGSLTMRYPGNDPECGPARPSCGSSICDRARDMAADERRYAMKDGTTLDQLHEEALEDNHMEDVLRSMPEDMCA